MANPGPGRIMPAHLLREKNIPCPVGHIKRVDGSCYKITGEPNITEGGNRFYRKGGITKPVKKMKTGGQVGSTIKMQSGGMGLSNRRTRVSNGHFHQMHLDVDGNGRTVGGDHFHFVIDNEIGIYCNSDPPYNCHTHS